MRYYDSRLKYTKNEVRLGQVENHRQEFYCQATGEWVLMLYGDDYLIDNRFITDAIQQIEANPEILFTKGEERSEI